MTSPTSRSRSIRLPHLWLCGVGVVVGGVSLKRLYNNLLTLLHHLHYLMINYKSTYREIKKVSSKKKTHFFLFSYRKFEHRVLGGGGVVIAFNLLKYIVVDVHHLFGLHHHHHATGLPTGLTRHGYTLGMGVPA